MRVFEGYHHERAYPGVALVEAGNELIVFAARDQECRSLHGHSFRAEVAVRGEPQADTGFIVDFETLEKACSKLHETLDHNFLNEIPGLETPSLENISRWIWQKLAPQFAGLHRVTVRRDSLRQGCSYYGEFDRRINSSN